MIATPASDLHCGGEGGEGGSGGEGGEGYKFDRQQSLRMTAGRERLNLTARRGGK